MSKSSKNNSQSQCQVVSKYFSSSPVMDESLSEFKEKKTKFTGPKNTQKSSGSKQKPKKAPKRIRGQKDIRTALKSKKNELLDYTKAFDEVCKQSGVDVDSEQLQLAIALSKSVQPTDSGSTKDSQSLSSQERTKKIRTTLQEYGFTVPEVKVVKNKQKKRCRKNYKLILATDEEKQQIISDNYAQVLFEDVSYSKLIDKEVVLTENKLYSLATGIPYTVLKSNDVFYVENLIERSSSNGNLLRDWAYIPGRSKSPTTFAAVNMNFSEIECSPEELDIVFSGTIKSAKSVIQNKTKSVSNNIPIIVVDDNIRNEKTFKTDGCSSNDSFKNNKDDFVKTILIDKKIDLEVKQIDASDATNNSLLTLDRVRSVSPDIFDDEVSSTEDNNKSNSEHVYLIKENDDEMDLTNNHSNEGYETANKLIITNANIDLTKVENLEVNDDTVREDTCNSKHKLIDNKNCFIVDLTEVNNKDYMNNVDVIKNNSKVIPQFSQASNFTRRNSNDFMEMTECVAGLSQGGSKMNQSSILNYSTAKNKTRRVTDFMEITECVGKTQSNLNTEDNIDLTQNHESINVSLASAIEKSVVDKVVDLSQSSNSEDELPFVQITGTNNQSLDDTILLDSHEIDKVHNVEGEWKQVQEDNSKDLLEIQKSPIRAENANKSASQRFFEEFVYNHSSESSSSKKNNSRISNDVDDLEIDLTQSCEKSSKNHGDIEVDLTQSSNSSVDTSDKCLTRTPAKSISGKNGEVSIDYDELFDEITKGDTDTNSKIENDTNQSVTYDITEDNNEKASESLSRSSQVFDLSDKELEYSLNKSKNDLPWDVNFGGISVMDNMSGVGKRISNIEIERQFDDTMNDLPMVNIKKNTPKVIKGYPKNKSPTKLSPKDKPTKPFTELAEENGSTPYKLLEKENAFNTETPTTSEYIIKTDKVTPMLDYASMSTPERNRELDKYGLKPFKRKRAIQLLAHLYTQTHPMVESCQEDLPSPSKKRKHSSQPSPIKSQMSPVKSFMSMDPLPNKSPKKSSKTSKSTKSPRKMSPDTLKSPNTNEISPEMNEHSDFYEVTNESPCIRNIECPEEDWVFQKREKAKVHSCRMPLHIAFHNYLSCRRRLREAILKYEPVNIDVIHKDLVANGFRCDPKDLLKYMDKKCITVKTTDNNARNNKR